MKKEIHIKRPNGDIEIVDADNKPFAQSFVNQAAVATREAGRGEILKMVNTQFASNMRQLIKKYNNLHNEGGEGYIPEGDYFTAMPEYKEWEDVKELIPA